MRIDGVIVPLLTPLNSNEQLDKIALGRLIDHVIRGGVAAIFILGSSGEAVSIASVEKEHLISSAHEYINGRVPLLVGVIEPGTAIAVDRARRYSQLGADAIVTTAPYYFGYTQEEIRAHFQRIAIESDIPVIVYNIPELAKAIIKPELMNTLLEQKGIIGIKDSAGNMDRFQRFLNLRTDFPDFQVWQGSESVAAISVARGATGLVLGLANIAPRLCVELYAAARQNDLTRAWALQSDLMTLFDIQRHGSFLAGLKTAANILGLCGIEVTEPFANLSKDQTAQVRHTLGVLNLL